MMIICTCSSIVQHCLFYQSSECHLRSIVYLGFERPLHAATVLRSVQHPGREPLIFYTNADPYALSRLLLPASRSEQPNSQECRFRIGLVAHTTL